MKTAIAKPLSAVIIIISLIVLFFGRNDAVNISTIMFLFLTTIVIEVVKER